MEETNESLFGLNIDPTMRAHLTETAKWANFLAIIGFILCALFVLGGIVMVTSISKFNEAAGPMYENTPGFSEGFIGSMGMIFYFLSALVILFPSIFMSRFAGKMKMALSANDQPLLANSLQNLKLLFRFWGITTIIVISIYILLFVALGAGWMMGSR